MTDDDSTTNRRRLARAVGALREARGLSRRELAEQSGLSYPYVSQIENGDREPSFKALSALARALRVEIGQLTSGEATRPPVDQLGGGVPTELSLGDSAQAEARAGWKAPALMMGSSQSAATAAFRNPAFAGREKSLRRRSSRPRDVEDAVAQAHRVLSLLSPTERLEAVTRLLQVVVPEVVEEQVRNLGR